MKVDFNRHKEFSGRISADIYNCLELLSKAGNGQKVPSVDASLLKIIKMISIDTDKLIEDKMKSSIYYIRLCRIIDDLLGEYRNYDDELKKTIIAYYIQSNKIKEMNNIGFIWYYDMKYKKDTSTLYSVGYGEPSNWNEWIKRHHNELNQIKEKGIQEIFKACKEHINKGGEIRLKSLSKCLGVDLFKYMQLDETNVANFYIIKNAPINFIELDGNRASLQEYLISDNVGSFDEKTPPNFCLDFSHPRKYKAENYNKWSKNFLENEVFISQAEFEKKKSSFGLEDDRYDYFILSCLQAEHTRGGNRAISSRVSPIADKEVVASDTLWKIEEYTETTDIIAMNEKCYHITFNESEYYQFIFCYFKSYYEKKRNKQTPFDKKYTDLLEKEREEINKRINVLVKENEELSEGPFQDEDIESSKKKIVDNEALIRFYRLYKDFLEVKTIDKINAKTQFALSFLDWQAEGIPKEWSLANIYTVKQNKEKNLILNLYKCLCKNAAFV